MTDDSRPLPLAARANLFAHLATMEQAGLPADKAFALLRLPAAGQARLDAARKLIARGVDIADAGLRSGLFSHVEARCVRAALQDDTLIPSSVLREVAKFAFRDLSQPVNHRLFDKAKLQNELVHALESVHLLPASNFEVLPYRQVVDRDLKPMLEA